MNYDDYEQLPTPSIATNMIAGGFAGILEHCVMYPIDSIKVTISEEENYKNITSMKNKHFSRHECKALCLQLRIKLLSVLSGT